MDIECPDVLTVGESGVVSARDSVGNVLDVEITCTKLCKIKNGKIIAKKAGLCEVVFKHNDDVKSVKMAIVPGEGSNQFKKLLIDTTIFPVLNPDVFILILVIIGCVVCTALVTLIFTKSADALKIITSLLTAITTLVLSVAKLIVPKGEISKKLENTIKPEKILYNTQEYVRKYRE